MTCALDDTKSTEERLPLPYSDCLLTMESDLQSEPKPVSYRTEKDVKAALKVRSFIQFMII